MVLTRLDDLRDRMLSAPMRAGANGFFEWAFFAMGTDCRLLFRARSRATADALIAQWAQWLAGFEFRYSRFIPESLIGEINRQAGGEWVRTDPELESLFALCDWYHWVTGGIFDPTSLPLLRLWDYKAESPRIPEAGQIRAALARIGWKRVEREGGRVRLPETGMALDLGGIGKEYAVDRVMEMAMAAGLRDVMISFGADVRVAGEPPEGGQWRIGLQSPLDPGKCWTGVSAQDRAVASSGDYLRYFEFDGVTYGHILDIRDGWPVHNGCRGVSVIAPTCTEAGILATAVFVLGVEEGLELLERCHQAEGCIWTAKEAVCSRRFDAHVLRFAS